MSPADGSQRMTSVLTSVFRQGAPHTLAPRLVLAIIMLLTGASGLVQQYIVGTVFTYLLGNSVVQLTMTVTIMMIGMGAGTFLQRFITKGFAEWFIATEVVLVLMIGFAPIVLQGVFVAMPEDFELVKYAYMFVPGLLVGMEIPLIMRINQRFTTSLGDNISETWAWDYVGGAIGGFLWLWLLQIIPLAEISFVIASLNLLVALVMIIFSWRFGIFEKKSSGPLWSALAGVTIVATVFGSTMVGSWSANLTQRLYDDPIMSSTTTQYQNIVISKGTHPTNPADHDYTLWLNGNKQFSSADEAIYHEYLVHPAMNMAARHDRVLILGGGDGLALREVLKYPDVKEATLVDLDPGMIELAATDPILSELNNHSFADARVTSNLQDVSLNAGIQDTGEIVSVMMETGEDPSGCSDPTKELGDTECIPQPVMQDVADVSVYTIDADLFLSEQSGMWDVIIVDLPDPNSIELAKLYSQEFYGKVKRILSPDGIMVVQSTSPYHAKETYLCIQRTIAATGLATMPYHDNVPSFGDWGWIIASPTMSPEQLHDRAYNLDSFQVETREVDAINMQRALVFDKGWLDSTNTEVSTLMKPVVFDYYTYEAWRVD